MVNQICGRKMKLSAASLHCYNLDFSRKPYNKECNLLRMLKWFVNPAKMFMLDNI